MMGEKAQQSSQKTLNKEALRQKERFLLVASAEDLCGRTTSMHAHSEGQLIYCTKGTVLCEANEQIFVLSPQRGLWVPPHVNHSFHSKGPTISQSTYIRPKYCRGKLEQVLVIHISVLLGALIETVADFSLERSPNVRESLVLKVLLSELEHAQMRNSEIPKVADQRLQKILETIYFKPSIDLAELEKTHHISQRTIKRLFEKFLGTSFSQYRQQAKINLATRLLDENQLNITEVAYECGYESFSAFSLAFKKIMGLNPSSYKKQS